jgi:hypothetical protein
MFDVYNLIENFLRTIFFLYILSIAAQQNLIPNENYLPFLKIRLTIKILFQILLNDKNFSQLINGAFLI